MPNTCPTRAPNVAKHAPQKQPRLPRIAQNTPKRVVVFGAVPHRFGAVWGCPHQLVAGVPQGRQLNWWCPFACASLGGLAARRVQPLVCGVGWSFFEHGTAEKGGIRPKRTKPAPNSTPFCHKPATNSPAFGGMFWQISTRTHSVSLLLCCACAQPTNVLAQTMTPMVTPPCKPLSCRLPITHCITHTAATMAMGTSVPHVCGS